MWTPNFECLTHPNTLRCPWSLLAVCNELPLLCIVGTLFTNFKRKKLKVWSSQTLTDLSYPALLHIDIQLFECAPAKDIQQNMLVVRRLFASELCSLMFLLFRIPPKNIERKKYHRRLLTRSHHSGTHTTKITWFTSSVRRRNIFLRKIFKFGGGTGFLFRIPYSDAANTSFSVTQHENSHLLLPHPVACMPPCSQHENESLQGWIIL